MTTLHLQPPPLPTLPSSPQDVKEDLDITDHNFFFLQEWDWTVLEHVLSGLPEVLQNKSLILSANPALNTMTSVLCHMVRIFSWPVSQSIVNQSPCPNFPKSV